MYMSTTVRTRAARSAHTILASGLAFGLTLSLGTLTITTAQGQRLRVALAIVPDEEGATATLSAQDELGEELARAPAPPSFKLTPTSALAWVESGFERLH